MMMVKPTWRYTGNEKLWISAVTEKLGNLIGPLQKIWWTIREFRLVEGGKTTWMTTCITPRVADQNDAGFWVDLRCPIWNRSCYDSPNGVNLSWGLYVNSAIFCAGLEAKKIWGTVILKTVERLKAEGATMTVLALQQSMLLQFCVDYENLFVRRPSKRYILKRRWAII